MAIARQLRECDNEPFPTAATCPTLKQWTMGCIQQFRVGRSQANIRIDSVPESSTRNASTIVVRSIHRGLCIVLHDCNLVQPWNESVRHLRDIASPLVSKMFL